MHTRLIVTIVVLAAAGTFASAAPPASQPQLGMISGAIAPADVVERVRCIDRKSDLTYGAGWNAKSGRFEVADLAPGRSYDLEVQVSDGRSFIGVDLSYEEDKLLRLARVQAGDDEPPAALSDDDRKQIERIIAQVETFHDRQRIVHLRGDHAAATALVELIRTRPFHSGKAGEWIRRVEIWHFKFQHGGWEKAGNAEYVLSRARALHAAIEKQMAREVYVPELGGVRVEPGKLDVKLDVKLPGLADKRPTTRPDET